MAKHPPSKSHATMMGRLQQLAVQGALDRKAVAVSLVVLLCLTFSMFADVLLTPRDIVLADRRSDLFEHSIPWRVFGFGQLRAGNLALWNPHIFSGMPFFGGFESALLYPPNWLCLVLPLPKAINLGIALHVFLIGVFMYLWCGHRGLSLVASLFSAILLAYSGVFFYRIAPGDLSNMSTMAWAPLIFLSIDGIVNKPKLGWCLLGVFATAMHILAGHPQYVYYTAIAAGLYTTARLVRHPHRLKTAAWLASICVAAATLTAVQLLAGIDAAQESARSSGLPFEYAASFCFPVENLVTLVAPAFFGTMKEPTYWGRWNLFETCLFFGVTGFALAVYGALCGRGHARGTLSAMILLLIILAFGADTPLFRPLYQWLPAFSAFRGTSKFIFPAALFIALLAGIGLDALIRDSRYAPGLAAALLLLGCVAGLLAICVHASASGPSEINLWGRALRAMSEKHGAFFSRPYEASFVPVAGRLAAKSLAITCVTCLVLAALMAFVPRLHWAIYAVMLVGVAEVFVFGATTRASFSFSRIINLDLNRFYREHPGDYRVLRPFVWNYEMLVGAYNIWGDDTGVLHRYAELIAFTQGEEPDALTERLFLTRPHRLFRMLRCSYVMVPRNETLDSYAVASLPGAMPRLKLIHDWRVVRGRDAIFKAMDDPSFDPARTVILETPPRLRPRSSGSQPRPGPIDAEPPSDTRSGGEGVVKVVDSSTDHLTVEATVETPAVLLITDAYSKGWKATALPGSEQQTYEVVPANYALQAIPLEAGTHRIRVEYRPIGFLLGRVISAIALAAYVAVLGLYTLPLLKRMFLPPEDTGQGRIETDCKV